jgi:hypothetical protein
MAGWRETLDKVTSNGTVVALITAVLASIIVPRIGAKLDSEKQLRAQRLKLATEFLAHNTETQSELNALFTDLALFDKDNTAGLLKANEYKQLQRAERKRLDTEYEKFDEKAWWWYWELTIQARVSGVVSPSELATVQNLNTQYGQNLVDATKCINDVWAALLRKEYHPGDPKNAALINQEKNEMDTLREKRNDLAMKYIQLFSGR